MSRDQLIENCYPNRDVSIISDLEQSTLLTNFLVIKPFTKNITKPVKVKLSLLSNPSGEANVFRINGELSLRTKVESNFQNNQVSFNVHQTGGVFVVQNEANNFLLVYLLVGIGILIIFFSFVLIYIYKSPQYYQRLRTMARAAKFSVTNKV